MENRRRHPRREAGYRELRTLPLLLLTTSLSLACIHCQPPPVPDATFFTARHTTHPDPSLMEQEKMERVGHISILAEWEAWHSDDVVAVSRVEMASSSTPSGPGFAPQDGTPTLSPSSQIAPLCEIAGSDIVLSLSASQATWRVWRGWGTSLAWFANYIGGLPQSDLDVILDFLFSQTSTKGLGLTMVRYNIGGGFNPELSPQFVKPGVGPWGYRGMPGFKTDPNGDYDWGADANQRKVLLGAVERGAEKLIAFSNSAPWFMTVSGDVAGGENGASNLKPESYKAFADYLADVVEMYKTLYNVTFQYLSPFNEPGGNYWGKGGGQEGCHFNPDEAARLLPLVKSSLDERSLGTQIVNFDDFTTRTGSFVDGTDMGYTSVLQVHGYQDQASQDQYHTTANEYSRAAESAAKAGKELWMTEWGPDGAEGSDLELGLYMARMIITSVNVMKAQAWFYWQPVDTHSRWSLIEMPWNLTKPFSYRLKKRFFILQQFTRLVPAGSIPVDMTSAKNCFYNTAAFYVPCKNQLVLYFVNQQTETRTVGVTFSGFGKAQQSQDVGFYRYRTSTKETMQELDPDYGDLSRGYLIDSIGLSVTTLVVSNVISDNPDLARCNSE